VERVQVASDLYRLYKGDEARTRRSMGTIVDAADMKISSPTGLKLTEVFGAHGISPKAGMAELLRSTQGTTAPAEEMAQAVMSMSENVDMPTRFAAVRAMKLAGERRPGSAARTMLGYMLDQGPAWEKLRGGELDFNQRVGLLREKGITSTAALEKKGFEHEAAKNIAMYLKFAPAAGGAMATEADFDALHAQTRVDPQIRMAQDVDAAQGAYDLTKGTDKFAYRAQAFNLMRTQMAARLRQSGVDWALAATKPEEIGVRKAWLYSNQEEQTDFLTDVLQSGAATENDRLRLGQTLGVAGRSGMTMGGLVPAPAVPAAPTTDTLTRALERNARAVEQSGRGPRVLTEVPQ